MLQSDPQISRKLLIFQDIFTQDPLRRKFRMAIETTFTPNFNRLVRPARAANMVMHSRMGSLETMRSVCHRLSMPPASHRSTQRQKASAPENGNSVMPRPTATFIRMVFSLPC